MPSSESDFVTYGTPPEVIGTFDLEWSEYMHYMYLPVYMDGGLALPERLEFLMPMLTAAWNREYMGLSDDDWRYVYVTARRGFATPGNPLNRPGWHSDGFGTDDVNYIWTDRFPTQFALGDFEDISDDHVRSIEQFEEHVRDRLDPDLEIVEYDPCTLLRLTSAQVHRAPIIHEAGERGFVKISFSNSRYNLRGNSHNHRFEYDWHMHDRAALRNDPAYAGGDAGPQEADHGV